MVTIFGMRHLAQTAILLACFSITATAAWAQDGPATTPTNIAELIPEGGLQKMDFFLLMEEGNFDGPDATFIRWQIEAVDEGLALSINNTSPGEEGFTHMQQMVFSPDGKLKRCSSLMRGGGTFENRATGTVEGDTLTVVNTNKDPGLDGLGGIPADNTDTIDLSAYDDVIPTAAMPLAIGYHLREETLAFEIRMADYGGRYGTQVMVFEDIGTEMMDVQGKQERVHVLVGKMSFEIAENDGPNVQVEGPDEQVMHLRCLPSGEIVQMKMVMEGLGDAATMTAQSVPEAEIRERFGDAAVDGAAPGEEAD